MPGTMSGDAARTLRQGLGMSARALAQELGTNESSVYRWEWRRERPVPKMYEYALLYLVRLRRRRAEQQLTDNCG